MKKFKTIILLVSFILAAILVSHLEIVEAASYDITANSGGTGGGTGTFSPPSITVNSGESVSITFHVPANDPYCCGMIITGNGGQFNTGTIMSGGSAMVNFTATSSFTFTSKWPTGIVKGTGTVNVNPPPPPPPPPPPSPLPPPPP